MTVDAAAAARPLSVTLDRLLLDSGTNTWRRRAQKHAFDTEIFVEIRPVETNTGANYFPISSLFVSCISETRIPSDRHGKPAPVCQRNDKFIFSDFKR